MLHLHLVLRLSSSSSSRVCFSRALQPLAPGFNRISREISRRGHVLASRGNNEVRLNQRQVQTQMRTHLFEDDLEGMIVKNTLIYKYERVGYFRVVQGVAFLYFLIMVYLAQFALTFLKDEAPEVAQKLMEEKTEASGYKFWEKINFFSGKYRKILSAISVFIGYSVMALASLYTTRSVHSIILKRGGQAVIFRTMRALPSAVHLRSIEVPLKDVSALQSRDQAGSFISVKIRKKWFFFLIDKSGSFLQPTLFDHSVGLSRILKK